jgi:hypothetical protein
VTLYIGFGVVIVILWWMASWLGRKFDGLERRLKRIEDQISYGKEIKQQFEEKRGGEKLGK